MRLLAFGLIAIILLHTQHLGAQCLSGSEVWDKVEHTRNAAIPVQTQIADLLQLQKMCIRCKATDDSAYSNLMQRLGALYYKARDLPEAIQHLQQSVKVGSLANGKNNRRYLSRGFFNLAMSYKDGKLYSLSIAAFDSCIANSIVHADNLVYAIMSYRNLSNIYLWQGDYQQSILHADKAAVMARSIHDPYLEASSLGEKAQALEMINQNEQASATIEESIRIYVKEFEKRTPDNAALEDLANIYTIYAGILNKVQKPLSGITYYEKAFQLFKKTGFNYGCFSSLNNIGYIYVERLKDIQKAKDYYLEAIKYAGNSDDTVMYYTNISTLFFKEKKFESSLQYLQSGLLSLPIKFRDTSVTNNPSINDLAISSGKVLVLNMIRSKAMVWLEFYRATHISKYLQQALSTSYLADNLVDLMRFEQQANESKLFWREHTHRLYENAIEACYLLNKPAEGFYFFEKGRAVLLNDQLYEQNWLVKESRSNLNQQELLKGSLVKWKRELKVIAENSRRHDELINLIFKGEQDLDQLLLNIKKQDPYYFYNYLDSSFVTITYLKQNILKEHHGLVELFAGDSAVYSLVVTPGQTHFTKIDKKDYDSCTKLYISYITDPYLLNNNFGDFVKVSQRLYQLIFSNYKLPAGRIIISPDGPYFPFEGLVTGGTGNSVTYFLNDYAVSYTYSVRYLTNPFITSSKEGAHPFMGVAPVSYPAGLRLSPLTGSDRSLEQIKTHFKEPDIFLFANASKNNFMRNFNKYKIIQLYTHASDSGRTGEPVIYFADSVLYLSDLITGDKPATRLIVLSACETGKGRLYSGEGVFSFNRGFAALGIPGSITNLWSVDSKTTYQLTELFYKYLAEGVPTDVALQRSKLDFIHTSTLKNQLPYFWAASILAGNTTSIELKKPFPWWIWMLLIGIVAIVFIVIKKKVLGRKK